MKQIRRQQIEHANWIALPNIYKKEILKKYTSSRKLIGHSVLRTVFFSKLIDLI